jgi:putative Mg2+ transporter-C (MgtC) family protein
MTNKEGDGVSSVWTIPYWETAYRLFMAVLLGGLIGWERERDAHPAGFRTHILVCLGSALIMLISIYGFSEFMKEENVRADPARLAAQVVSGIGFLGAGTILRHGLTVSGLTTAASLWVVAGIGLAVGAGYMFGAVLTTILALVSLELLNRLEKILVRRHRLKKIVVSVRDEPGKLGEIASLLGRMGASIRKVTIDEGDLEDDWLNISFTIRLSEEISTTQILEEVRRVTGVKEVRSG